MRLIATVLVLATAWADGQAPRLPQVTLPGVCNCTSVLDCTCATGTCKCKNCESLPRKSSNDGWQWDAVRNVWWRPLPAVVPIYQSSSFQCGT